MDRRKAGLLLCTAFGSQFFLNGCSTFMKDIIMSSDPGRFAAHFFGSKYQRNIDKDFYITMPESLYSGLDSDSRILLMIHGFGSSADDLGVTGDPNSPVAIASREYDGNILVANYPSRYTIEDISNTLMSKLEKIMSDFPGRFPRIDVLGHSMGGEVARYMVREKPEYFRNVALVAAPSEGVDFGVFTSYVAKNYSWILDMNQDKRTCLDDLFRGSDFYDGCDGINKPTKLLDISYSFFAFVSTKYDNKFIPGEDDALVPLLSAYPYDQIRRGRFENVQIKDLVIFKGDVNHHTLLFNPYVVEYMLDCLKQDKIICKSVPTINDALTVVIPEACSYEIDQRIRNNISDY